MSASDQPDWEERMAFERWREAFSKFRTQTNPADVSFTKRHRVCCYVEWLERRIVSLEQVVAEQQSETINFPEGTFEIGGPPHE